MCSLHVLISEVGSFCQSTRLHNWITCLSLSKAFRPDVQDRKVVEHAAQRCNLFAVYIGMPFLLPKIASNRQIFLNLTVVCCSGSETARCEGYRFNGTVWQLVGDARAGSVL